MFAWETLFEGEVTTETRYDTDTGGYCRSLGILLFTDENFTSFDSTGVYRLTVDDVSITQTPGYSSSQFSGYGIWGCYYLGNLYAWSGKGEDNGGDFGVFTNEHKSNDMVKYKNSFFFTRNPGTYSVKIERSDPIPVPTIDPASMTMGWIVGRRIAGQRKKREPVAYLYNGVRLPKLPEWDKETYPYIWIHTFFAGSYVLVAQAKPATAQESHMPDTPIIMKYAPYIQYGCVYPDSDEPEWECLEPVQNDGSVLVMPTWANHDILYEDGTVLMAASEPVPVYE